MAVRSLNKVQLIGNLTRDPELRYTPQGTAVCSLGLATNRSWTTESGERREETEFHRIVAWAKLAELCSQLLFKGRRVYVEGRLQTRQWTAQDGGQRSTTEIIIDDMIILDSKHEDGGPGGGYGNNSDRGGGYRDDDFAQGPPSGGYEEIPVNGGAPAAGPAANVQPVVGDDQGETKVDKDVPENGDIPF